MILKLIICYLHRVRRVIVLFKDKPVEGPERSEAGLDQRCLCTSLQWLVSQNAFVYSFQIHLKTNKDAFS